MAQGGAAAPTGAGPAQQARRRLLLALQLLGWLRSHI